MMYTRKRMTCFSLRNRDYTYFLMIWTVCPRTPVISSSVYIAKENSGSKLAWLVARLGRTNLFLLNVFWCFSPPMVNLQTLGDLILNRILIG